ncbi:putative phage abortive infection protein [Parabacteroides goldsteinii]|uniref:putative phage abortive infection protein n=1 Tax=Parabacteroides goldsteinii TaxID=328812 RepID=UPI0032B23E3B
MGQEQMNTPNSTNTVDMNLFKSLAHLLSNSYRNHFVKFWINVGLLIISISILIIIRTDNGFIPSLFSYETNRLINLCIDYVLASYIIGLYLYIFWKASPIKKEIALSSIITFLILGSIIIALWLIPVYNVLQHSIIPEIKLSLGEFGSFFASITGLLAFLAVLYTSDIADKRAKETIALTKEEAENNRVRAEKAEENNRQQVEEVRRRYREDSERTIFFQLLELHTKKVESVIYSNANNIKELVGARAFERFVDKANTYWVLTIIFEHILTLEEDDSIYYKDAYMKVKEIFEQYNLKAVQSLIRDNNNRFKIKGYENIIRDPKYMDDDGRFEIWSWAKSIEIELLKNENYSYITKLITMIADVIYKEYGHILGHYFRNMFYVMDTINEFSDKKNYKELFRAQLSRFELTLGLFNAVSSNSSIKMVKLLEEFDVFKDVYPEDLQLLKTAKEIGINPNTLINNILNEYKAEITKLSDN